MRAKLAIDALWGRPCGTNQYFRTQDLWQADQLFPLQVKGRVITRQFDAATADPGFPQMYVNFLSYADGF
ncbi:hypothetical protein [Kitasatospora sp. NPDC098663]|uniref:hypothetical protein n=1 Tax=Kitasatospora sp. NPDC098663 TaxID=3364096 RepID=UPI00381824DC